MATYYSTLFARLGRLFAHQAEVDTIIGTIDTEYAATVAEWSGLPVEQIGSLALNQPGHRRSLTGLSSDLVEAAQRCLIETTDANFNLRDRTVRGAVEELVRQMIADSETVDRSAITVGSLTAGASNYGTGTMLLSATSPNLDAIGNRHGNLQVETIRSETIFARCEVDSAGRYISEASERFRIYGQRPVDRYDADWPGGSGADTTVDAVSPRKNGGSTAGQQVLANGDFEDWKSNAPLRWTIASGIAGTHILAAGSGFTQSDALKIVGDGSTTVNLSQTLGTTAGSTGRLNPDRPYSISFAAKYATLAPGVNTIVEIVDAGGTVYESAAIGREARLSVASGSLTTSWQLFSGTCFLPPEIAKGSKVVVRTSGNVANTSEVFVDDVTVAEMYPLGRGNGYVQILPGATPYRKGDEYQRAFTNNEAGQVGLYCDRFFGLAGMGLALPSSSSPTILDSVIA